MGLLTFFAVDISAAPSFWTRIAYAMLHSFWIGAAIGVAILLAFLALGKRRPRARYVTLLFGLALVAVSPVIAFATQRVPHADLYSRASNELKLEVPGSYIEVSPLPAPDGTSIADRYVDTENVAYTKVPVPWDDAYVPPPGGDAGPGPQPHVFAVTPDVPRGAFNPNREELARACVALYAIVACALLIRLAIGIAGGTRLRRTSQLVTDGALLSALARHTQMLGMRITPAIAHCSRVTVPTVVGVVRPMILLPLSATTGMTPEQIEYLVLHELAHIRRYDHVVNLLQRLIEALMFYHPVVWLLSRQIRIEREHCCDDMVVRLGGDARHYAESLLAAAALAHGLRAPGAVPTIGATGKASHLRRRIARMLGEPTPAVRLRHSGWIFAATCVLVGVVAVAQLGPAAAPEITADGTVEGGAPATGEAPGNRPLARVGGGLANHLAETARQIKGVEEAKVNWRTVEDGTERLVLTMITKPGMSADTMKDDLQKLYFDVVAYLIEHPQLRPDTKTPLAADDFIDFETIPSGGLSKSADATPAPKRAKNDPPEQSANPVTEPPPTSERIYHKVVPPPDTPGQPDFPAVVPEAIGQLQDKDWWLRKLAVQQLVDSGWKDAWRFIVPLLNDEDKRVQAAAAIALGALKEPKSIKHLVAALKEGSEVSDASAKSLAHFDPAQVMPLVRLAAQDEDNGVRRGAVKALREVKSPEVPALIVELLAKVPMVPPDNPNVPRPVRRGGLAAAFHEWNLSDALANELARTFASIETTVAAEAVELAATNPDWNVRAAHMKVLAQPLFRSGIFEKKEVTTEAAAFLNRPEVVDAQVRTMQDPQKDVRVWAAVGLGLGNWVLTGNPDIAKVRRDALIAGLRDKNLQIAQMCAAYLTVSDGSTTWKPATDEDAVAYAVALKNRDGLVALGEKAVPALAAAMQMDTSFPLTGVQGPVAELINYADALAAIGGAGAVEPLIGILESANDDTTRIVCNALGDIGDARAVEPLIRVARTGNFETQYAAIDALAKLKDKRAADVFLAALNVPDDPSRSSIRAVAATAAAAIGETRAVPILLAILAEVGRQDRKVQYVQALGELGDRSAVPSLSTMLADIEQIELSLAAAEALGKLGGDQARDALLAALRTHPGPQVRGAAAAALGVIKDPVAIAPLSDSVQFDEEGVRQSAARSIAQIGTKQAFDALRAIYPDSSDANATTLKRAAAIQLALCESGAPEALDVLYDLLRNALIPDPKAQLQAALALADKKDPRAADFLNKLRGNRSTRIDSERALSEMEGTAPETPESSAQPAPEATP